MKGGVPADAPAAEVHGAGRTGVNAFAANVKLTLSTVKGASKFGIECFSDSLSGKIRALDVGMEDAGGELAWMQELAVTASVSHVSGMHAFCDTRQWFLCYLFVSGEYTTACYT